jgi:prolyl oligopeptidase
MITTLLTSIAFAETPEDPFIWLEDVEGERALNWVKKRNQESSKALGEDPRFSTFFEEAKSLLTATDRIPYGNYRGRYVYNFWQDKNHVRGLWRRATLESYSKANTEWDTLLDIDELAKLEDENWVFKGSFCLPPAYTRCLVKLSRGGKDASIYREFDIDTKTFVKGGFEVPEAKSSASWIDKDTLLIGTDWGDGSLTDSGYPRILKTWRRGTPLTEAKTVYEAKKDDVAVWPWVSHRPDGEMILAYRALTFFTTEYHLVLKSGQTRMLPLQPSAKVRGVLKRQLILSLREAWTINGSTYPAGALLSTPLDELAQGRVGALSTMYTPSDVSSVEGVSMTRDALYVSVLDQVKGALLKLTWTDRGEWDQARIELPKNGSLRVVSANDYTDKVFVNYEDYVTPDELMMLDDQGAMTTLKSLPKRFNSEGINVKQVFAKSKDGTEVPYFLITPKNVDQSGKTPTLLYGYGGFEISLAPSYMSTFGKLWLERGGAVAIANIRGGGEYGPRWHRAALKENRQRAFDDFIAVAESLIESGLTSNKHLGIMGGSNGGLLVGATFTQRPELFNAVVCQVPLLDMIRYTKLLAGASWAAEYGDPEDPKMRSVIEKYSPYQNVKADQTYPKVLFITSTKDDRVHPGHARKMAARMLAMGKPVHYYENIEGGHSASANQIQRAHRTALEFVYLWQRLGRQ